MHEEASVIVIAPLGCPTSMQTDKESILITHLRKGHEWEEELADSFGLNLNLSDCGETYCN